MLFTKKFLIVSALVFTGFTFTAPQVCAKGSEYEKIVSHLKTKYKAKKVSIPFIWLARFAVSVARPAGVKSFSITMFEDLKFSRESLDKEMQAAMRNSFGADWSPIFHIRSRTGEQAYMYMRESGKSVKIAIVTIDKEQAAIIRATFSPEKLAEFINNPKVFGVSLNDTEKQANAKTPEPKENVVIEKKAEEPKKDN